MEKIIKYIKSFFRVFYLKLRFGKRVKFKFRNVKSLYIGKGVQINIKKGNKLIIGENTYIDDYSRLECSGGNIYIGKNTFINNKVNIISLNKIVIGDMCLLGPGVGIYDHDHCYKNVNIPITQQGFITKEINICNDVWLGTNCIVTRGVNIESKCVIGANSVVTKNINKMGIYAGSPCKFIKGLED